MREYVPYQLTGESQHTRKIVFNVQVKAPLPIGFNYGGKQRAIRWY